MLTVIPERSEAIKRFRSGPWPFQQTFQTPLKDLDRFVSAFLAPFSFEKGALSTDEVVFEPKTVLELLARHSVSLEDCYHFAIEVEERRDIADLLHAVLKDWIDFVFVTSPQLFAIYGDHDEYTTFYTPDEPTLKTLGAKLIAAGFEPVINYTRG